MQTQDKTEMKTGTPAEKPAAAAAAAAADTTTAAAENKGAAIGEDNPMGTKNAPKEIMQTERNLHEKQVLRTLSPQGKAIETSPLCVGIALSPNEPELAVPTTDLRRGQALFQSQPGAVAVGSGEEGRGTRQEQEGPARLTVPVPEVAPACGPGLAEATPVKEDEVLATAQPEGDEERAIRENVLRSQQEKKMTCLSLGISGLILVVILVVGIVLGVTGGSKSSSSSKDEATQKPTPSPTSFVFAINGLPDYTQEAILSGEPDSPQLEAYNWIINDPSFYSMSEWKVKQRFALAVFYYATSGSNWTLHEGWLDYDTDECFDWYFRPDLSLLDYDYVEPANPNNASACDEAGSYTVLIQSKNNLAGNLPREISLLTQLQYLDTSNHEDLLAGSIPSQLGLLTNLKLLAVDRNTLVGPIPTELGLLTNLVEVYLGNNPYQSSLPTELGQLGTNLKKMNILRAGVTGFIPTELFLLTSLEELLIQNLQGVSGGTLEGIGTMTNLGRFDAYDIPYNTPIPSEIGLLTNMGQVR